MARGESVSLLGGSVSGLEPSTRKVSVPRGWLAGRGAGSYAVTLRSSRYAGLDPAPAQDFAARSNVGGVWQDMALENCTLCRGTGWKLVARADGARGNVAVACDCGMEERAARVVERARVPKRYEHCDFESYVTDLVDGKTWTTQHSQSLKNAKMLTQGFVQNYPSSAEKGLLLMGPSGVGKTHLGVASLKELIRGGHAGLFCDYRALLQEIQ